MPKDKRKFLTIKEKWEILQLLQKGSSITALGKKYNVGKSTIFSIRNKKEQISKCVNNTYYGPGKRKTLRTSELPIMEKSLYKWFIHMRNKNLPVSGLMLKGKAKQLHTKTNENGHDFNASDGWLQKFKQRYGVRLLQISGEKLSAQPQLVDPFKRKLKAKMEELGLTNDQLYNADESGLFWKLLPQKTYVTSLEKNAPGAKMEKQRVTFLCCANASGSHKTKLLVIGKSKNPRSFKNFICPVHYKSSKSAWMTSSIFKDWFHYSFVPEVTDFLTKNGLPVKALLLIDNAPSHPPEYELKTEDGSIQAMFMPPNVTPLIQPMDQNAIQITKLHYRNSLLATIIAKEKDWLESMKQVTIKEAITLLEEAWSRDGKETLAKCWKNVLNMVTDEDDPEYNVTLSVLKSRHLSEIRALEDNAVHLLQTLFPQEVCTASSIGEWNNNLCEDVTLLEENDLDEVSDDDDCIVEEPENRIKAKDAVEIFNKALQWAESEMIDQSDLKVLKKMREVAIMKLAEQKKTQKMITEYFPK